MGLDGVNGTNGIDGIDGTNGTNGSAILSNLTSGSGTASVIGLYTTLLSYPITAGLCTPNESLISAVSWVEKSVTSDHLAIRLSLQGGNMFTVSLIGGVKSCRVTANLTRKSTTTSFLEVQGDAYDINGYLMASQSFKFYADESITFANSITVEIGAILVSGTGTGTAKQLTTTLLTK